MNNQVQNQPKEIKGHCNCCGKNVPLLIDEELGESICKICHSYDVTRKVQ